MLGEAGRMKRWKNLQSPLCCTRRTMIYLPLLKPVCISTLAFTRRILPGRKCLFAFAGLRGFRSVRFSYQMWILSEIVGISCARMGWVGLRTKQLLLDLHFPAAPLDFAAWFSLLALSCEIWVGNEWACHLCATGDCFTFKQLETMLTIIYIQTEGP